jgi:TPP-dependent pyruvate/acetoin dehydrogenase alpha subunit
MEFGSLNGLDQPEGHNDPLSIDGVSPDVLRWSLERMMLIRLVEQHIGRMREQGQIGGPVHLAAGQEAIAVGVSRHLRPSDFVFGAHRSHGHVLALGASVRSLLAEVLGRATGLSRGMGGSMHLWDGSHGFHGSVPIVAATVPIAVGAGLAAKLRKGDGVAVCYMGDGATEEGVVHESLNLARVLDVPVLFVIENNLFSSHMHISLRQPFPSTARFAEPHGIRAEIVDGNDVVAIDGTAGRLLSEMRRARGPALLEAVTYRWYGHVDGREDTDVGLNRSGEDLARWHTRDPVERLRRALLSAGLWTRGQDDALTEALCHEIQAAWTQALNDPWPSPETLLGHVYAAPNPA